MLVNDEFHFGERLTVAGLQLHDPTWFDLIRMTSVRRARHPVPASRLFSMASPRDCSANEAAHTVINAWSTGPIRSNCDTMKIPVFTRVEAISDGYDDVVVQVCVGLEADQGCGSAGLDLPV